jgi:two-component system OmpR family response regulator
VSERTLDSHVRRIRAKLREAGHDPIETVHGLGYRLRA